MKYKECQKINNFHLNVLEEMAPDIWVWSAVCDCGKDFYVTEEELDNGIEDCGKCKQKKFNKVNWNRKARGWTDKEIKQGFRDKKYKRKEQFTVDTKHLIPEEYLDIIRYSREHSLRETAKKFNMSHQNVFHIVKKCLKLLDK